MAENSKQDLWGYQWERRSMRYLIGFAPLWVIQNIPADVMYILLPLVSSWMMLECSDKPALYSTVFFLRNKASQYRLGLLELPIFAIFYGGGGK